MTDDLVSAEEARRLREAATAGPWSPYFTSHGDPHVVPADPAWLTRRIADVSTSPKDYGRGNCELIAAAPSLALTVEVQAWRIAELEREMASKPTTWACDHCHGKGTAEYGEMCWDCGGIGRLPYGEATR